MQIRLQDSVQAAAAAQERLIRADNYRATLLANMQLAQARAARDEADRQRELARSEAELASTIADPYLAEAPAMAASSLSPFRYTAVCVSNVLYHWSWPVGTALTCLQRTLASCINS